MKILILDNYDSFTYNLAHMICESGFTPEIVRNDKMEVSEVGVYDKILLSPGPGLPEQAGIMKEVIRHFGPSKSILGICLGHQGIAEAFGASLFNMKEVLHGVTSSATVVTDDEYLFDGLSAEFQCTHYHSWAVEPGSLNRNLEVTATNAAGLIMGLRHKQFDVRGLQFHPESILTPEGSKIINNWLTHEQ